MADAFVVDIDLAKPQQQAGDQRMLESWLDDRCSSTGSGRIPAVTDGKVGRFAG
jgi:hypothetical protein